MKYLTHVLALTRLMLLKKQWRAVRHLLEMLPHENRAVLAALVYGEAQRAAKHPLPQFYGSSQPTSYSPWGDAVERSFERIQSDNEPLRMRGIATWLAVVYHETRHAPLRAMQALHQEVDTALSHYRSLHERVLAIRMAA